VAKTEILQWRHQRGLVEFLCYISDWESRWRILKKLLECMLHKCCLLTDRGHPRFLHGLKRIWSKTFDKIFSWRLLVLKWAAWRKYKRFKTISLLTKYKQISIRCSHAINDFIATYENNLISPGNLGSFYRYVNDKLNGSNGIAPLKLPNGEFIFDDTKKANLLNEYFGSVYTIDNDLVDFSSLSSEQYSTMECVFFTPDLVCKYIKYLKSNGAAGPDSFLQYCLNSVCIQYHIHFL